MAAVHTYAKQLRIDANIEVVMALNALQAYIRHKREKDPARPLGRAGSIVMQYSMPDLKPLVLVVYETQTTYVVRDGRPDQQTIS